MLNYLQENMEENKRIDFILRLAVFGVLFARGVQHIFFDVPYRSILWNQDLLVSVFKYFNLNWQSYASSPSVDLVINSVAIGVGILLILSSFIALFKIDKLKFFLIISSLYLVFLSFLYFVSKYFVPAQFIEYAAQMISPIALYFYWREGLSLRLVRWLKIALALTFVGHGSYALGLFPVPGHFIDMVIMIMKCDEATARVFLKIMGTLDFIAALFLFIPSIKLWALNFCFIWGLGTSLARVIESDPFSMTYTLVHYGYQFLYRVPHFLIPLVLILNEMSKGPSKD